MLVFLNPGRNAASPKKYREGGTAKAADLQTVCSVGPPTVSDTSFPTDQFSVGDDYVLFLALSTEIGLTNRKEKPLRSCSLTTASVRFQRAFVSFSGRGRCFHSTSVWLFRCCQFVALLSEQEVRLVFSL
jgi:hypothetical protein